MARGDDSFLRDRVGCDGIGVANVLGTIAQAADSTQWLTVPQFHGKLGGRGVNPLNLMQPIDLLRDRECFSETSWASVSSGPTDFARSHESSVLRQYEMLCKEVWQLQSFPTRLPSPTPFSRPD
jgi:hypothetical protein